MKKTIVTTVVAIALGLVLGSNWASACPCSDALSHDFPKLGTPPYSEVSDGPIENLNNLSAAVLGEDCFVMYAGGGAAPPAGDMFKWKLYVKRYVVNDRAWVMTNGGRSLNYYGNPPPQDPLGSPLPEKKTGPYFYEFKLIVLDGRLFAVFTESDGDGLTVGQGHKIVHVKQYDPGTGQWLFVEGNPTKHVRLGLNRPFYPGNEAGHWSYFDYNGVVAIDTACDKGLYVAWGDFVDPVAETTGDETGQVVVRKYAPSAADPDPNVWEWTTLPTTGLPPGKVDELEDDPGFTGSVGLGQYEGQPVVAYKLWHRVNGAIRHSLRVARFDGVSQSWIPISGNLNVVPNTRAGGGLLAESGDRLYVAWREGAFDQTPPYSLYVKSFDGSSWTSLGEAPAQVTTTAAGNSGPVFMGDQLVAGVSRITLIAWGDDELNVKRFNGTNWNTIATTGTGAVSRPYNYYMSAPSIAAAPYGDDVFLAWQSRGSTTPDLLT